MSEALAGDLSHFGVGVSVLCPGFVDTEIFSSERNRPDALGGTIASVFDLPADQYRTEEERAWMQAGMDAKLDPALIGDMVLHAVLAPAHRFGECHVPRRRKAIPDSGQPAYRFLSPITPASRMADRASSPRPSSAARTSSVCSPSRGGADISTCEADSRGAKPSMGTLP